MKYKLKRGLILVLAASMLIPSAVSAQIATNKGNIFDEMNKNESVVGKIQIEGDITSLELEEIAGYNEKNEEIYDDELVPRKTKFNGSIVYFSPTKEGLKGNGDLDLKYDFKVNSEIYDINKELNGGNLTKGEFHVRGNRVYIPSALALKSLEKVIEDKEFAGEDITKYKKAYNSIKNNGNKYVQFDYTKPIKSKDTNKTIDQKQLEVELEKFADRMEKEIYKDYKLATPHTLTKDAANITLNKDQVINEIVHFVDYTLQRLDRIIQIFMDCFGKTINQIGKSEDINDIKSEITLTPEERSQLLGSIKEKLNYMFEDVKFNLNYNVKCVNPEKKIYLTTMNLNISLPDKQALNLEITAGQQANPGIKLMQLNRNAYDITSIVDDLDI